MTTTEQHSATTPIGIKRFDGRVAVVTGSSSGQGRAISLRLAAEGAAVVCVDLRKSALPDGFEDDINVDTDSLIEKQGGRAVFVTADVTSEEDLAGAVEAAVSSFGSLDVWVNNAGAVFGLAPVTEEDPKNFKRTLDVNLYGTWLGCRLAARQMQKQEIRGRSRGRIVNIGSVSAPRGAADTAAYAAAKGGVHHMTHSIAVELAPWCINVNTVAPGYMRTAMNRNWFDDAEAVKDIQAMHPLPLGTPEDVAAGVAYLASDDAAFVTGVTLPVDGGFLVK